VAAEMSVETPLEVREPIVDAVESLVDTVEASIHVGAHGVDARDQQDQGSVEIAATRAIADHIAAGSMGRRA
jgi:hypothetical protein